MAFIPLRTAKKWFRSEINAIFFRYFLYMHKVFDKILKTNW